MTKRLVVTAQCHQAGEVRTFETRGQTAKALLALVTAGDKGVTASEVATWAYRLAAYRHDLKRIHGLDIITRHEEHPGGWHGRYILLTPVQIVSIDNAQVPA